MIKHEEESVRHTPGPWYAREMPEPKGYAKYQIQEGDQG